MSSANRDGLILSSQLEHFFSCLITLDRISSSMLNRSGDFEHPYPVPEHMQKAFNFTIKYYIIRGILLMPFQVKEIFVYYWTDKYFVNGYWR